MVDLLNPTRCAKISGKVDKPKHLSTIFTLTYAY